MKRIIKIMNTEVFLAATLAIMAVFYEGMTLKWYVPVGVMIMIMDFSFILSTVLNLIHYRKDRKILSFSIFSFVLIVIAIIMKVMGIKYPVMSLVFWYFYLWFYYGFILLRQHENL